MKLSQLSYVLISALFVTSAYAQDMQTTTQPNTATTMDHKNVDAKVTKQEAEILAFIIAADEDEIKTADLAASKNVSSAVSDYAKELKSDHSKNLDDAKALSTSMNITPDETKSIEMMKKEDEKNLTKLNSLNDTAFDKAFITAMIDGHEQVLDKLNRFSKEKNSQELHNFIENTKVVVKKHLEEAKKIKHEMK